MNINTKSWHYKLYKISYKCLDSRDHVPSQTNLCDYMKHILGFLFLGLTLLLLAIVFVMIIGELGVMCWHHPIKAAIFIGGLALIVLLIIRSYRIHIQGPTIIGQWVQAKKQKLCPVVNFTDDKTTSE